MPDSDVESAQILERLQAGDDQALGDLFSTHRDRLWRMVNFRLDRRLLGRVDADDILQEAYLDAAQRIHHYFDNPSVSIFIWLRQVVGQTLIDVHRRHLGAQKRNASLEVSIHRASAQATSVSLAFHLLDHLTSPSQIAMREEMSAKLEGVLDTMNDIDREVLALRHFEELTNSEVAETLGIQQKAASIRYIRAIARLKDILSQIPGFFDGD